jgi:hypothetical protein
VAGAQPDLTADVFEPHRGSDFRVRSGDGAGTLLRLDDVQRFATQPGAPRADPFSLTLSGSPPVLAQRTFDLEHDELGTLDVFLVPIEIVDGRVRYEAVFN